VSNALAVQAFVDRDTDATEPRAVHAHMRHQPGTGVDDGYVIGDFYVDRLVLTCGNDAPGVFQAKRYNLSWHFKFLANSMRCGHADKTVGQFKSFVRASPFRTV
jgi:hypothetical protein